MVGPLDHCPEHWRRKCYPRKCQPPPKPQNAPPPSTHNVLYLVDEHDVTNGQRPIQELRNSLPVRRYVWHHSAANLETFNIGEEPDTINLHESIANPEVNKHFRWHGYIFDVPGGKATCRVCISAGAAEAKDSVLSGPVAPGQEPVDRVVGFAGTYSNNAVPIGLVTPVRRDDKYRVLHTFSDGKQKLEWRCAYYISKEVPKKTSGFSGFNTAVQEDGNPDQAQAASAEGPQQDSDTVAYNALMDDTARDDVRVAEGEESWGGNLFGFTIQDEVAASELADADDPALKEYSGDALEELKKNTEAAEEEEKT